MVMRRSLALALAGALFGAPVLAADMGYAPPPEYPLATDAPATLGNGWYLRGDAGWTREQAPVLANDRALAGVLGSSVGSNDGWAATIGAGYQFNSYFRSDLTLDYRNKLRGDARSPDFACVTDVVGVSDAGGAPIGLSADIGDCHTAQRVAIKRTSLLANAYFDLGTWAGVTPYVGAGVGVTYSKVNGSYGSFLADNSAFAPNIAPPAGFPETWVDAAGNPTAAPVGFTFGQQGRQLSVRRAQTNLTWALMAGLAVDVSPNAKIDIGYRFVNMGSSVPGGAKKDGRIQELRLGLRYSPD